MKKSCWRERQFALVLLLLGVGAALPGQSSAALVTPLYDLRSVSTAPFPSDRWTTLESRNLSNVRMTMPKPNCTSRPTDCTDIDVINSVDGFSTNSRITFTLSAAVNLNTVNNSTVWLVRLGDIQVNEPNGVRRVNLTQFMWDPATKTLSFEPTELLDQHTRYLAVLTTGIRDANGNALSGADFWDFVTDPSYYRYGCCDLEPYRYGLIDALQRAAISPYVIVSATAFTTMSATAELEKMRDQIKAATPAAANFRVATGGTLANFPISTVQSMVVHRQTGTAPTFTDEPVPTALWGLVPGALGSISFGKISSREYRTTQGYIPSVFTKTGSPVVQRTKDVHFTLYLPAGPKPAGGWPVAIYGHGFPSNRETLVAGAAILASRGIATIAMNVEGHGGGSLGTLTVTRTDGSSATVPAGGNGSDQDHDGIIGLSEGIATPAPRTLIEFRDGMRQTVVELMELVRVIETNGIDADADGSVDLNRNRIYYFGVSFGGMYGPMLMAVDPAVRVGAFNVPGGTIMECARLGGFREYAAAALGKRTPSLLNMPTDPVTLGFKDNFPLRNLPNVVVNNVAGAMPIQEYLSRWEWVSSSGDPLSYVQHVQANMLSGVPAKSVLVQIAKGDQNVPNPTNTAFIRAGGLQNNTTYFRNDLAVEHFPTIPRNPHAFLGGFEIADAAQFAVAAQTQLAVFFQSDGATIIDPDGAGSYFETPIVGPLPEELNFLPPP